MHPARTVAAFPPSDPKPIPEETIPAEGKGRVNALCECAWEGALSIRVPAGTVAPRAPLLGQVGAGERWVPAALGAASVPGQMHLSRAPCSLLQLGGGFAGGLSSAALRAHSPGLPDAPLCSHGLELPGWWPAGWLCSPSAGTGVCPERGALLPGGGSLKQAAACFLCCTSLHP